MPTRGTENLTVTIVPTAAAEGDDVIPANVSIGSSLTTDLVVDLSSSDLTEVVVPTNVIIAAGRTSVDFNLSIVDDLDVDGDQTVTITAEASGYGRGTDTITIHDNAAYVCEFSASDEDYVDFGAFQGFTYNTNWTIEEKVKLPSGATTMGWHFFRGHAWGDRTGDIAIQLRNDVDNRQVYVWVRSGGWRSVQMDKGDRGLEILDDTWYTICLQYNFTTTTLNLYVNGLLVDQNTGITAMDDRTNTNPLFFGGQEVSGTSHGDLYSEADIVIANQAWFQRNLSVSDIADYDGTVNLSDPDLFFATNITSSAIYDDSGNGRNGTNGNSPEYYMEDHIGVAAKVYNLDRNTWHETIQDAVDSATSGDHIWISEGTYNEYVVVNKVLNITGNSTSTTIISGRILISSDWVNVSNIQIVGGGDGIYISGHDNCRIENIYSHSNHRGILIFSGSENLIIDSDLSNNSYTGVGLYSYSDNNIIRRCTINDNGNFGVDIYSRSESNIVDRSEVRRTTGTGIFTNVDTDGTVVTNCTVESSSWGISINRCSFNIVRDNTVFNCSYGVEVSNSGRNKFESNNVSECYTGIHISNSNNDTISGNDLKTGNEGIRLDTGNDALIEGNIIDSYNFGGITNYYSLRVKILNNSISSSFTGLLESDTWHTNVSENTFRSCSCSVDALRTDGISFISNDFLDAGWYHLFLRQGSDSVVEDNEILNGSSGIYVRSNPNSIIRSNTFLENSGSAITFETSGDNALIHNNSFLFNGNGGPQVSPNTGNSWNLPYPGGGNYWSDYTGTDRFSGPDQDIYGSDGMGDAPFDLGSGAKDMYPLMAPSGTDVGDILITSQENGDVVSGKILIEAVSTAPDTARVDFLVNGNISFTDYSEPYQFILDTTDFEEDSYIRVTASALRRFGPDINDTVRLLVNNRIDSGDFISVETAENSYSPDQTVTAMIDTNINTPPFDTVALRINCNSPSGPIYFISNSTYPESVQWVLTFPLPSDVEEGGHLLNVTAFGYMKGELLWWARDTYNFTVSGSSLHGKLEDINTTLSSISSWSADLDYQNMTIREILDRVKHLQNDVDHLNVSAGLLLDEIIVRLGRTESNLTSRIEGMNSSLQSAITVGLSAVFSRLDDVDSMLSDIDTGIAELNSGLEDLGENLSMRLERLEREMYENISALREYIELRSDQMTLYLEVVNASLHYHLAEIQNDTESFRTEVVGELSDIRSYLEGMNRTGTSDRIEILRAQEASDRLIEDLNNVTISEIRSRISDLRDDLVSLNGSEAQRHASTLSSLLEELEIVNGTISDHLSQIVLSLEALQKLEEIMNDLEVMDKNLDTTKSDLSGNDNGIVVLLAISLVILVAILILLILMMVRKGAGGKETFPDSADTTSGNPPGPVKESPSVETGPDRK